MNRISTCLLCTTLLHASAVGAAGTVTGEVSDNLPGEGFGALTGFMVGAAAGGPIGALVGAGVGGWGGGVAQETVGLSGTAYRVERDDGRETTVRSPNHSWSPGDRVQIIDRRLVAEEPQSVTSKARY